MKGFTAADVALIKHMTARGHDGTAIAKRVGRTALAIRHNCCELGMRLRSEPAKDRLRILLERPFYAALIEYARLLSKVCSWHFCDITRRAQHVCFWG